ncbi:MAG: alkaline phosphatase D family protein [Burkholderiaceae bacterium]
MFSSRRSLLKFAAAAALPGVWRTSLAQTPPSDYPFPLGVASGPGLPSGVVLWTRYAPGLAHSLESLAHLPFDQFKIRRAAPAAAGAVELQWEVAADEGFTRVIRRGTARATRELGHSVHVELPDLPVGPWLFYRFRAGSATSPVGRTRAAGPAERLRFALASCQHYETGHFGAYRHMLADEPDFVLFVGDYIYEGGPRADRWRPHPFPSCRTLADYRLRYSLYKSDPALQAMHAHCPWLTVWDDHEVSNDYARDRGENLEVDGRARRLAGYQAYYENMPLPVAVLAEPWQHVRLWRSLGWGDLAHFTLLDGRQYRDPQACPKPGRGGGSTPEDLACPERRAPQRSMLGAEQLRWLQSELARPNAQWQFVVQQTLLSSLVRDNGVRRYWTDGWDGYPAERERILAAIAASPTPNTVVLGGDVHANWVCNVKRDFEQAESAVIATEFCGTSISSESGWDAAKSARVKARNPHALFGDSVTRGYLLGDLSRAKLSVRLRGIDDARQLEPTAFDLARFEVLDGQPGARRLA